MFYGGMVAVMAAPFTFEFIPPALTTITNLSYRAYQIGFTGLNNLKYAVGSGAAMYFQKTNLPVYNSLMNFASSYWMLPSGEKIVEWYNTYQDFKDIHEHYIP